MSTPADLLAYCRSEEPWLLETIESLVRSESPSNDKAAVDRCGDELAARLEAMGGRVTRVPSSSAGDHVRAEFGEGARQLLLLGHFDTVWEVGQLARMPLRREGGRLHGPGVFDMKAGIALGMLATRALLAHDPPNGVRIVMLWTSDEEVGSKTSRALLESEAARSEAVLVLEPSLPGGALKTQRKGVGEYQLVVRGKAAHAGVDPSSGVSAVHELARQILEIEKLQDLERGVSLNVGIISGGTRVNVVAEEATARIDARAPSKADADRIDRAMRSLRPRLTGAGIEVTGGFERPPLERTPGVARLFEVARAAGGELGIDVREGSTGGGSDGSFCAALGIPTLDGLGAIGDGAHALHEHVEVEALAPRAALIALILAKLAAA
jgi:glutamate carboxypeptidase